MKFLYRAAVALSAAAFGVAVLAPPAAADEIVSENAVSSPAPVCQRIILNTTLDLPVIAIDWVEVCTPQAAHGNYVVVDAPTAACPTCLAIYSPQASNAIYPLYVRMSVNGAVIQQQYPFGTAHLNTPGPVCIVATYSGAHGPCLV